MEKFRFAFVSFSPEIAQAVKLYADAQRESVTLSLAAMENAVTVAKQLLADGVDVVIGGGETGNLLVQTIGQPVVNLQRSYLDLIEALVEARGNGARIALTSFGRALDGTDVLERLLGIRIRQIVFNTSTELEAGIERCVGNGYATIVGGGICKDIADRFGGRAITIMPRKQRIIDSLIEARAIATQRRLERRQLQEHRTILETIKEGVLAIDVQGRIKVFNSGAARILNFPSDPVQLNGLVGRRLPRRLRDIGLLGVIQSGRAEVDAVRRVGGVHMVISCYPVMLEGETVGAVGIFKETTEIQNIDRRVRETLYLKGFVAKHTADDILGHTQAIRNLRERTVMFAKSDANVLVEGETGTGKEILASAIHAGSRRANNPFVPINCAALPDTLLESELFGYEEGAFTGAKRGGKIGLFELANHGTLFLDEVADISSGLQVRLLRVLEENEILRVGGDKIVPVDVRVICASHKSLTEAVGRGGFRQDLYFRISTLKLSVPPLRQRLHDIPLILEALFAKYGLGPAAVSQAMREIAQDYHWPGNVRELDALVCRYLALSKDQHVVDEALFATLLDEMRSDSVGQDSRDADMPLLSQPLKEQVRRFEERVVARTLEECGNRRKKAAERLGISLNSLWRKMPKPGHDHDHGFG